MKGISVIIPCYNKVEITKKCVQSFLSTEADNIEYIFIDNASTDETARYLLEISQQKKDTFKCILNNENLGIVGAFNQGTKHSLYDIVVFMHNDVIIHNENWPELISSFFSNHPEAGIVGLYGAKRIRKDGSFMGRGIVHSKLIEGNLKEQYTEVSIVDGLFMALRKDVLNKIGGFDTRFNVHYYDKDISMSAIKAGYKNYVINIPFTHKGGSSRSQLKNQTDNTLREEMKKLFLEKWKSELPLDVRGKKERIKDWLKKYV